MVAPSHQGLKSENKSIDDPLRVGRAEKAGPRVEMGCDAFTVPVAATVHLHSTVLVSLLTRHLNQFEWREIRLSKLQNLEHFYPFDDKKFKTT